MSDEEMVQSLIDSRNADEKKLEQKLTEAGAVMPQGRAAYSIAHYTGCTLYLGLDHYGKVRGVEATPEEIRMPKEIFEDALKCAIRGGERGLRSEGGYFKHCLKSKYEYVLNSDFNEKAKTSLLQEIYSRLQQGEKFNLLKRVNISTDKQQRICLRCL